MSDKPPGIWSVVLVAAAITLVITILRVVGELQGWSETLVGPQGLVGITLLIPIFGLWFGWRLRRSTGTPAHAGKAALFYVLAAAVLFGAFWAAMAAGLIVMPTEQAPGVPDGMVWAVGIVLASIAMAFAAWPRLSLALFVYAVLARIPIIVVTFLSVSNDWDTHYTKLPPEFALPPDVDKTMFLAMPQATFWIAFTMAVGGLFGCAAAALARRRD